MSGRGDADAPAARRPRPPSPGWGRSPRVLAHAWAAGVVAVDAARQAVRVRLPAMMCATCGAGLAVACLVAPMVPAEAGRIVVDAGLAGASGVGSVVAVGGGIALLHRDLAGGVAYPVLARAISRPAWLLGRALGLWVVLAAAQLLLIGLTAGLVTALAEPVPSALAPAAGMTVAELAIAVTVGLTAGVLATPTVAAAGAASWLVAGHLAADVLALAERQGGAVGVALRLLAAAVPDLARLSLRPEAANGLAVAPGRTSAAILYACAYAGVALALGMVALVRRRAL